MSVLSLPTPTRERAPGPERARSLAYVPPKAAQPATELLLAAGGGADDHSGVRVDVRVVPLDAVPDGAVVLGVLVALAPTVDPVGDDEHASYEQVRSAGAVPVAGAPGLTLDRLGRCVLLDGVELDLTRREFDLFEHLVTQPGRVFTRRQLLSSVWAFESFPRELPRTVDVHVARLRRKLAQHARLLQSVRGVGYRWVAR